MARRSRVALRGRKFVPMFATCMCGRRDTPRSRRGTCAKISVLQEAEKEAVLADSDVYTRAARMSFNGLWNKKTVARSRRDTDKISCRFRSFKD